LFYPRGHKGHIYMVVHVQMRTYSSMYRDGRTPLARMNTSQVSVRGLRSIYATVWQVRAKAWWLQPHTDVAYTYYHSDIGCASQFKSLKRKVQHRAESALARDTRGFHIRRLFSRTADFTSYQLGVISHQSVLVRETSHWTRLDLTVPVRIDALSKQ